MVDTLGPYLSHAVPPAGPGPIAFRFLFLLLTYYISISLDSREK